METKRVDGLCEWIERVAIAIDSSFGEPGDALREWPLYEEGFGKPPLRSLPDAARDALEQTKLTAHRHDLVHHDDYMAAVEVLGRIIDGNLAEYRSVADSQRLWRYALRILKKEGIAPDATTPKPARMANDMAPSSLDEKYPIVITDWLRFTHDHRGALWCGKELTFRKGNQAKTAMALARDLQAGGVGLKAAEIKTAIGSGASSERGLRVDTVFSGNTAYGTAIIEASGTYMWHKSAEPI